MKFYHLPTSCSDAVHAALKITGEPFDAVAVDMAQKDDSFLKANPLGKVPALMTENGPMFEGGAINLWLSQRHPEANLMPDLASPAGAEALKWLFYCYGTIHPVWVRFFFPQRIAGEGDAETVQKLARADSIQNYSLIAQPLENTRFVAGDDMSLADLYLAATLHWEGAIDNVLSEQFPALARLKSDVWANPLIA